MLTMQIAKTLLVSMVLAIGFGPTGCSHSTQYIPPRGSIGASGATKKTPVEPKKGKAPKLADVVVLVAHDAQGKPVMVEIQQSSGDEDVDQRALQVVAQKMQFPKGKADTTLVTIPAKSVPKK